MYLQNEKKTSHFIFFNHKHSFLQNKRNSKMISLLVNIYIYLILIYLRIIKILVQFDKRL